MNDIIWTALYVPLIVFYMVFDQVYSQENLGKTVSFYRASSCKIKMKITYFLHN